MPTKLKAKIIRKIKSLARQVKKPDWIKCSQASGYRQARAMHREFVNLIIPINRFPMGHANWVPEEYEAHVVRLGVVVRSLSMRSEAERNLFSRASGQLWELEHSDEKTPSGPHD